MPRTLKRRSDAISRDASADASQSPIPTQRRRRSPSASSNDDSAASAAAEDDDNNATNPQAETAHKILVKKLVRLALATEYSRAPLRRADISIKIFKDTNSARRFKLIFADAQKVLERTFGMKLVELPFREKTSLKDRRAQATQTKAPSQSSKSWILTSTLHKDYKTHPAIVQPTHAPSVESEAGYTALYTFILALIYLNHNDLPDPKLERYLKRVNADTYTEFGSLEKVLQRMVREGYLDKRRETSSGEEVVSWSVGPRGKVEVGINGVVGLVKSVYGFGAVGRLPEGETTKEDEDDLNARLSRSLGVKIGDPKRDVPPDDDEEEGEDNLVRDDEVNGQQPQQQPQQKKSGRRRAAARDNETDEDD